MTGSLPSLRPRRSHNPRAPLSRCKGCWQSLSPRPSHTKASGRTRAASEDSSDSRNAPSLFDEASTSGRPQSSQQGHQTAVHFPTKWLSVLSTVGVGITGYLTWARLFNAPVVCPTTGSCETVLSSDYATVFGLPLSLLGLLGYAAVAALSTKEVVTGRPNSDSIGRPALLTGGAVLASCSGYLLYLLVTEFPGETCAWCISSALVSMSIFILAAQGLPARELKQAAKPAGGAAVAVIAALTLAWSGIESPKAFAELDLPYRETVVRSDSSDRAVQLARRLKGAGARMFGAFWCSHCQEQKLMFGKQAQGDLPYVECFPEGWRKGVKIQPECAAAGVQGFPSWIIGDKHYEGERSFGQLEEALDTLDQGA